MRDLFVSRNEVQEVITETLKVSPFGYCGAVIRAEETVERGLLTAKAATQQIKPANYSITTGQKQTSKNTRKQEIVYYFK